MVDGSRDTDDRAPVRFEENGCVATNQLGVAGLDPAQHERIKGADIKEVIAVIAWYPGVGIVIPKEDGIGGREVAGASETSRKTHRTADRSGGGGEFRLCAIG